MVLVGARYWTGYRWDDSTGGLVRAMDNWIEFRADDLLAPLAG